MKWHLAEQTRQKYNVKSWKLGKKKKSSSVREGHRSFSNIFREGEVSESVLESRASPLDAAKSSISCTPYLFKDIQEVYLAAETSMSCFDFS